ncbi:MAG: tetratricopeptide repeat protein, partial [Gemmatimonadota bacterium]
AYSERGDVDEALGYYEALLAQDSSYRYQAAADLAALAERARDRGASENMARALQPLLAWGPGYVPTDLRRSLAHHYWRDGDYARSLALHLAVLGDSAEVEPGAYYETGRAYEELGGCERALPYFEEYMVRAGPRDEEMDSARWHYGNCLFLAADADRAAGRPRGALDKLDRMVRLGVPRTYLDDAHFLRGEMLFALGDVESALGAYRRVLDLNPARSGALVRSAEARIRQIVFAFGNE